MFTVTDIKRALRDWWVPAYIAATLAACLLYILSHIAGVVYLDRTTIYVLQILSGNWSPDGPSKETIDGQSSELLVGGTVALLLNLGVVGSGVSALLGLFYVRKGLRAMNMERIIQNRDMVIKRNILEVVKDPEIAKFKEISALQLIALLSAAYNKGVTEWEETYLERELGPEEQERLHKKLLVSID